MPPTGVVMADDVAAAKETLRAQLRKRRAHLRRAASDDDWAARGQRIATAVLAMPVVRAAVASSASGPIAIYESTATEPPTKQLVHALLGLGADVVVPVVASSQSLAWVPVERDRPIRQTGPAENDGTATGPAQLAALRCPIVIAPALAVGRDHSRLGQGGGYFDRSIAAARSRDGSEASGDRSEKPIIFIALIGPGELLATVPHDELDQLVDGWCVG